MVEGGKKSIFTGGMKSLGNFNRVFHSVVNSFPDESGSINIKTRKNEESFKVHKKEITALK